VRHFCLRPLLVVCYSFVSRKGADGNDLVVLGQDAVSNRPEGPQQPTAAVNRFCYYSPASRDKTCNLKTNYIK